MGTIIKFPRSTSRPEVEADIDYDGLELFVASCWELLDALPVEARHRAKQEFNRLVKGLLQFLDECQEGRRSE
jgi:hypothetical protein